MVATINYARADRFTLAMKVGVPVVPGTPGPVDSYTDGESFIKEYGFPGNISIRFTHTIY